MNIKIVHFYYLKEWTNKWLNEWMNTWTNKGISEQANEGNALFNDTLNTFYLRLTNEWVKNESISDWVNEQKHDSFLILICF